VAPGEPLNPADPAVSRIEQVAAAVNGSVAQQAGRDVVNISRHIADPREAHPSLISTVPPKRRSKKVRGRKHLLKLLEDEISNPSGKVIVLYGGGGFGKTTLALEAAHIASGNTTHIWWVSASDTNRLAAGMREVALHLGIPAELVSHAWSGFASAPDLLWKHLRKSKKKWILLIDDANEPQSLAAAGQNLSDGTGWLRPPPKNLGTIVVTTRDGNRYSWGDYSCLHRVDALDDASGGKALLDLAGHDAGSASSARALSTQLGGLPLALHIAGTYLAYSAHAPRTPGVDIPRTFNCYRRALERQFALVIDRLPPDNRQLRAENELVTRTWELSLDLLARQGHPKARSLMRFLACFSQAPIVYDMLDARKMRSISTLADLSPEELQELLHLLCDFGLIDCFRDKALESHVLALHPLVRETNLHHLSTQEVHSHTAALLRILEAGLEHSDPLDPCNRLRWLATALHGKAPMALILNNSGSAETNALLPKASLLEYTTMLFLEIQAIVKESSEQQCR
jgi:hypothetical protein